MKKNKHISSLLIGTIILILFSIIYSIIVMEKEGFDSSKLPLASMVTALIFVSRALYDFSKNKN